MGMRFDLTGANWLACLLEPGTAVPVFEDQSRERETLRLFLEQLSDRFFSSQWLERDLARLAESMLHDLDNQHGEELPKGLLVALRQFLGGRPWTALIISTGHDRELDKKLGTERFLRHLVEIRPDDPGLILQLEESPQDKFALLDVFPAFRTALAESTNWPGILIWSRRGDSVFLPFGTQRFCDIKERSHWIFSHLATSVGVDLALLKSQYIHMYPDANRTAGSILHFLQLSDLHLGSKDAGRRLPRVQQLVRNVIEELGASSRVVPVVTGDLMDSPSERHLNDVRGFMDFLSGLGVEDPSIVLGNHDVRQDGYLLDCYKPAIRLPSSPVRWFDDEEIGLLSINSVVGGRLARGSIGETQLMDLGSELDRSPDRAHYQLVAMLHHHPMPVEVPDWYARPFYARILGSAFEKTVELEDAGRFLAFAAKRSVAAVLHGHKHIPQATKSKNGIPILGCGSSVGKVSTKDGGTYMSLNVISIDGHSRKMAGRLLAERIPGGGLVEQRRHEMVIRTEGNTG